MKVRYISPLRLPKTANNGSPVQVLRQPCATDTAVKKASAGHVAPTQFGV